MNNKQTNKNKNKNNNINKEIEKNNEKTCHNCGKKNHLIAQCYRPGGGAYDPNYKKQAAVVDQKQVRDVLIQARNEIARHMVKKGLPIAPMARAGAMVKNSKPTTEKKLEAELSEGAALAGKRRRHAAGFDHNYVEHVKHGTDEFGAFHHVRGCERAGTVVIPTGTTIGDLLDFLKINPTNIGPYTNIVSCAYAKYLITAIRFRYVSLITQLASTTEGDIYFGLNLDPDNELPTGETGLETISEARVGKKTNFQTFALNEKGTHYFDAKIDSAHQVPLFVQPQEEGDQWQIQAVLTINAGASIPESVALVPGEYFIEYDMKLYDLNPTPQDMGLSTVVGYTDTWPTTTGEIATYFTRWIGSNDCITLHDYSATSVSFSVNNTGTYCLEFDLYNSTDNTVPSTPITVRLYKVRGRQTPTVFNGTFIENGATETSTYVGLDTQNWGITTTAAGVTGIAGASNSCVTPASGSTTAYPNSAGTANRSSVRHKFYFSCAGGTPVAILSPIATAAVYAGQMSVIQMDNTHHQTGEIDVRPTPSSVMTPRVERQTFQMMVDIQMAKPYITDADFAKLTEALRTMASTSTDAALVAFAISKLRVPVKAPDTTGLFAPAVVAAVTWAVTTFGPILAEKAVDWVKGKLEGSDKNERENDRDRSLRQTKEKRERLPKRKRVVRRNEDDDE